MTGKMDCAGLTDRGRVRASNEDQFLIATLNKAMQVHQTSLTLDDHTRVFGSSQGHLLLVADGMGGHAAGKRASTLAVDSLVNYILNTAHWFFRLRHDSEEQFLDDLRAALGYAQDRLQAEAQRLPERRGMGTTVTMAYVAWPRLFVVHVGDSRCYLLRKGRLEQITRDHTIAQELAERGALQDPEESRWSHVLWNVVGGGTDELHPEVYRADLALGDTILLCSDGLCKYVPPGQIAQVLNADLPSEQACRRLVDLANAAGGADNITTIVAQFRDAAAHPRAAQAAAHAPEPVTEKVAEPAAEEAAAAVAQ